MSDAPRAQPTIYPVRSEPHQMIHEAALKLFDDSTELISAVRAGNFAKARNLMSDDMSLTAADLALGHRWLQLETCFHAIRYDGQPAKTSRRRFV